MSGVTLDAGALIAFERNDLRIVSVVVRAHERGQRLAIPTGVVGQVWRDGATQARLARLLKSKTTEIVPLDLETAKAAAQLCGTAGTDDLIDASVVLCARRRRQRVATSDPQDIARLDPTLELVLV